MGLLVWSLGAVAKAIRCHCDYCLLSLSDWVPCVYAVLTSTRPLSGMACSRCKTDPACKGRLEGIMPLGLGLAFNSRFYHES